MHTQVLIAGKSACVFLCYLDESWDSHPERVVGEHLRPCSFVLVIVVEDADCDVYKHATEESIGKNKHSLFISIYKWAIDCTMRLNFWNQQPTILFRYEDNPREFFSAENLFFFFTFYFCYCDF